MPKRWRTPALRIAASLAIGAEVTVLVAWGCTLWSRVTLVGGSSAGFVGLWGPGSRVELIPLWLPFPHPASRVAPPPRELAPFIPDAWLRSSVERSSGIYGLAHIHAGAGLSIHSIRVMEGADTTIVPSSDFVAHGVCLLRAGWPLPALACVGTVDLGHASGPLALRWEHAAVGPPWLSSKERPTLFDGRIPLPWRPLVMGFAINTAIFGTLAYLAWSGPGLIRRRSRRRRRGLCPACGYPRSGLPGDAACPECGAGGSEPRGI